MTANPLKDIIGSRGDELKGKRIALCITGSVAAINSPDIARLLMRHGADVHAVLTRSATKVAHSDLLEWSTGNSVVVELTGKGEHLQLAGNWAGKADLILIAPCTANTISKIALGIDDSSVTTVASCALGTRIPMIIAPAMHEPMLRNPFVQENLRKLEILGIEFVGPILEEGKAKMATPKAILEAVLRKLSKKDLEGLKILVTGGPTVEHIDPVRVITNMSSGRMGAALAEEAFRRGGDVTLIYGKASHPSPDHIKAVSVETTKQLHDEVARELKTHKYDVAIAAAAPADFTLDEPFTKKVSTRSTHELTLKLKPTMKVIDFIKKHSHKTFLVAFKTEHKVSDSQLVESAYELLKTVKADLVVANDVARKGAEFGAETNEVFIVDRNGKKVHLKMQSKESIAANILDEVVKKLKRKPRRA